MSREISTSAGDLSTIEILAVESHNEFVNAWKVEAGVRSVFVIA